MQLFECQNCYNRSTLDQHGRCKVCGSDAVASINMMRVTDNLELLSDIFTSEELREMFGIVCSGVAKA